MGSCTQGPALTRLLYVLLFTSSYSHSGLLPSWPLFLGCMLPEGKAMDLNQASYFNSVLPMVEADLQRVSVGKARDMRLGQMANE